MTITKETELINAVFVYFHRCQEEEDFTALQEMGFGPNEIRALNTLSSADELRLASTRSHFLSIRLNRKIYWRMIDYVLREKSRDAKVDELISCDAPLQLMRAITGMGTKQFNLRRNQFGLQSQPTGRPPQPTKEVQQFIWSQVEALFKRSNSFGPDEFLQIFNATERQISLRVIWNLIHTWENDGSLKRLRKI